MSNNISRAIYTIGIAWGMVAFVVGLGSAIASPFGNVIWSLIVLIFGFLIILPIAITAIWKPKLSASLLVLSFFLFECGGFADDGLRGVLLYAKKLALPNILLVCGYAYAASVRAKAPVMKPKTSG
jgi:hypothetical protein